MPHKHSIKKTFAACPNCLKDDEPTLIYSCEKCYKLFCQECGTNPFATIPQVAVMAPLLRCPFCTPSDHDISTASHWNPPLHSVYGIIMNEDDLERLENTAQTISMLIEMKKMF